MKIALIQSDLTWENKEENIKRFDQHLSKVSSEVDLILLPEMFTTGFSMSADKLAETMDGESVQWMQTKAKEKDALIAGSLIIKENEHHYNRLVFAFPNGQLKYYNKRHLFTMGDEPNHYTSGTESLVFDYKEFKIKAIVCYDLRFPVWARNTENYDLILCVANWPEVRSYPWRQLLIARAIENQCFVAAVNRVGLDGNQMSHSGNSMMIDFKGQVMQELVNEEGIIMTVIDTTELQKFRVQFPVLNDRDSFQLI